MKFFLKTYNTRITILLLITVIINIIVMRIFDAPLKNEICKSGIISFELAKDLDQTVKILDSWDANAKTNVSLSLGFDFLFLLIYSSFIALLIYNINNRLWKNKSFHKFGYLLIVLIFSAAFFDIIENIALIKLLLGDLEQIWSSIAYYFAVIKFVIILICIVYLLVNWLIFLFMKTTKHRQILLTIITLLTILISCNTVPETKNIVFILADDFGYNDMSFRNNDFYETPNIDNIAKEGMVFNEGYATCQVCSPSRASIMSGKFPARHGITDWIGARTGEKWREKNRHNKLLPPDYIHNLPSEYLTLPEALREEGYATFFAGKWHLGGKGSWPEDHGFDVNIGGWQAGSPQGGYFSPFDNPNLKNNEDGENLSMRLANETVNFIKDNKDEKFFAFLSFYAVHGPIQTTQEKWKKYRLKAENNQIEDVGYKMGHFLPIRQTQDNPIYAGLVESMDDAIGVVLNSLKELGLEKNTIVIFTSDNGGVAAGDDFSTSNLPLRAGKGYQFEGGIKEPYIIKVPWMEAENKQYNTPVTGTDFYPTILDLIGVELKPSEHSDGVSLLPLIRGEKIDDRPLIWHYPHYGNQGGEPSSIIRQNDWKLIHYYEDGRNELYNLKDDVEEAHDLAMENINMVSEMNKTLFDYLEEVGAKFPVKDSLYNSELEAAYLENVSKEMLQNLEKQRLNFLSADFEPKNNWWGSQRVED